MPLLRRPTASNATPRRVPDPIISWWSDDGCRRSDDGACCGARMPAAGSNGSGLRPSSFCSSSSSRRSFACSENPQAYSSATEPAPKPGRAQTQEAQPRRLQRITFSSYSPPFQFVVTQGAVALFHRGATLGYDAPRLLRPAGTGACPAAVHNGRQLKSVKRASGAVACWAVRAGACGHEADGRGNAIRSDGPAKPPPELLPLPVLGTPHRVAHRYTATTTRRLHRRQREHPYKED